LSGVPREDIFITVKSGFAGPMGTGFLQPQIEFDLLGIKYADLYLMHEGELGTKGHMALPWCRFPTSEHCRSLVWRSCLHWIKQGRVGACGVANWEIQWLQALKQQKLTLPAVVQMKFHPHQSLAHPRIKEVKDFCDENGIIFNGYSPLGRSDWTTFESGVGTERLLDEPVLLDVAQRVGRSPAQVLLRWNVQQGVPTQVRSMNPFHMRENIDIFDWQLAEEDMARLSNMTQCNTFRGNAFDEGDYEHTTHGNMIGPTKHC